MIQYIVFLGFVVLIWGDYAYIRDTLKGKTKPNRITYLLWAAAGSISFFASVSQGATWATVPVFATSLLCWIILGVSFLNPNAYWRLGRFDWICGALSLVALVLWLVTKNANTAIVFAILSDILAAYPTMKKSWTHPETETAVTYGAGAFNAFTSFLVAKQWTFGELAFPTYYFLSCLLIFALIVLSRHRLAHRIKTNLLER